MPTEHRVKLSW